MNTVHILPPPPPPSSSLRGLPVGKVEQLLLHISDRYRSIGMLTAPLAYPRSADAGFVHSGLATLAYGLPDDGLNYHDDFQLYDFPYPSFAFDSDLLLLDSHQDTVLCHSEVSFSSSLCQSWPDEPFPGQYLLPEMASMQTLGAEAATTTGSARSCSPTASDSSTLSDVASYSSDWSLGGQAPGVGPSVGGASAGPSRSADPVALPSMPSSVGPIRRGRGRPRKDAPPVVQPPPLCTYIDPLAGTPCNKLLNRHHDLPRHMFKHCQEEAALVISGRLKREDATLLPPDWKGSDEMKLPCRFCNQRFSRADAVKRHEKKEHKSRPRKG